MRMRMRMMMMMMMMMTMTMMMMGRAARFIFCTCFKPYLDLFGTLVPNDFQRCIHLQLSINISGGSFKK